MADIGIKISATDAASGVFKTVAGEAARLQSSIGYVSTTLASMGVSLSAGAFLAFVTNINNGVDALNDLKDATGASIENISALEDVARRTGSSFDTVSTALVKLNQGLSAAKPGSDTERAIKALGLSVSELKALDPAEAFRRIAVSLSGFEDDANKARLTQELFGKSLKEVAPLLKDLAEQGQLNATVTTAQAEAAEKLNKQIFNLQKNALDAGRAITGALVPALSEGVDRFLLAHKHAGGLLDTLALYARLDYSKGFQGNLAKVEEQIAALEQRAGRITSDSARKGNDKMIADLRAQAGYLKELRQLKILEDQGDNSDAVSRKFLNRKASVGDVLGGDGGKAAGAAAAKALSDQNRELAAQANLLATLSGVNGDYQEQLTRLQVVRKSQNLSDARYSELVTELIDKQPMVKALYAEQEKSAKAWADQSAASAKAVADLSKDYDAYVKTLDNAANAVGAQVQKLQDEEAATIIAAAQNISLAEAIEQVTIARLGEAQAKAYANGDQEAGDAIKREIEERKKLATLIGSKEVRDANKRAADDAAKEWQKTADKINDSITDALMRGFEDGKGFAQNMRDTIENIFKTMVLRPVVQATVNTGLGALGIPGVGGSSGGTGGLLNAASSLNTLYGTASQALFGASVGASSASLVGANAVGAVGGDALGALIASNGGWAGVSVAAEAGAAAGAASGAAAATTAAGGAAAGGAGALAAIPGWGWALGGALLLGGLMGGNKNWETKYGGSFDNTGPDGAINKISGPGTGGEFAGQYAQKALKATEIGINETLKLLGSKARLGYFSAGAESSGEGQAFANAGGKLMLADGSVVEFGQSSQSGGYLNRRGNKSPEQAAKEYGEELQQATLQALQTATDIPLAIRKQLDGVDIDALTGDALSGFTAAINKTVADVQTLQSAMLALPFDGLKNLSFDAAAGLIAASGGFDKLNANITSYYDNFYSAEEKRAQTLTNISKRLADAGITLTTDALAKMTRGDFRALVETIEKTFSPQASAPMVAALLDVNAAFSSITPAAQDAIKALEATRKSLLDAATGTASAALSGLTRSVEAQKSALASAYEQQVGTFTSQLNNVTTSVGKLQSLASSLKGTLDGMRIAGSEGQYRAEAQAQIKAALAIAKAGGPLPLDGQLDAALRTVAQPSEQLYATFTDYARDFYKTANDIAALGDLTGAQLTADQVTQNLLQDQIDLAKRGYDAQIKGLDDMVGLAQQQLEAANGTYNAILSLTDAIKATTSATQGLMNTRAQQGLTTGTVTVGGALQSVAPDTGRLDSINKYINTLDFSEAGAAASVQQLYAAAKQYGVNQAELAAASGYHLEDVQKLFAKHGIPAFDVGTNYVPQDMLAQIHKGEAIIPAAYNPAAGGQGAGNTAVLEELRALRAEVATLRAAQERGNSYAQRAAATLEGQNGPILMEAV